MSESTATLDRTIAEFAAAVRRHLDDLPLEDIDDLTGGLEADLSEQASDEHGDLHLDDPAAYAEELRASAGLPPRANSKQPLRRRVEQRLDSLEATIRKVTHSTRLGSWLVDFAVTLRPVWWVLRGWVVYQLLTVVVLGQSALVPSSPITWGMLFAAVVLSVQWGRGRWAPNSFVRALRTGVSVVAIVATPFVIGWALNEAGESSASSPMVSYTDPIGLWLDGQRVTNIFGYDAEGNPITDLQLFDQNGDPLVTVGEAFVDSEYDYDSSADGVTVTVPSADSPRGNVWNVYPLKEASLDESGEVDARDALPATPPFRTTNAVPESTAPMSTATPAPTITPTPSPTATPSPTEAPAPTPISTSTSTAEPSAAPDAAE